MPAISIQRFRGGTSGGCLRLEPLWSVSAEACVLRTDGSVLCGSAQQCDIRIPLQGVESVHCRLSVCGGTLTAERLGGPIWINDCPVTTRCVLDIDDVLSIGPASYRICFAEMPAAPHPSVYGESREYDFDVPSQIGKSKLSKSAPIANADSGLSSSGPIRRTVREHRAHETPSDQCDVPRQEQAAELQAYSDRLNEFERELNSRSETHAANLAELQAYRTEIAIQREQVLHARAELSREENDVARKNRDIDAATERLLSREQEISAWQQELDERARTYELQQTRIAALEAELDRRAAELTDRADRIEEEALAVREARHLLEASDRDAARVQNEVQQKDAQLADQASALASRESALADLRNQLELRQSEFDSRYESFETQAAELNERSRLAEVRANEIAERSQLLDARQQLLNNQQNELSARRTVLEEEFAQLAARTDAAAEFEMQLKELQDELRDESEVLQEAHNQATQTLAALDELQSHVSAQNIALSAREKELEQRSDEVHSRLVDAKKLARRIREEQHAAREAVEIRQAELEQLLQKATKERTAADVRIAEACAEATHLAQSHLEVSEQLATLEARRTELASAQAKADEQLAELQALRNELESEAVEQLAQNARGEDILSKQLQAELNAERSVVNALRAEMAERDTRSDQLQKQLTQLEAELAALKKVSEDRLLEANILTERLQRSEAALAESHSDMVSLTAMLDELKSAGDHADSLREQLAVQEEELRILQQKFDVVSNEFESATARIREQENNPPLLDQSAEVSPVAEDSQAEQLLEEILQLRDELAQSQARTTDRESTLEQMLADQNREIDELTARLGRELPFNNSQTDDEAASQQQEAENAISALRQQISDRDSIIRQLREKMEQLLQSGTRDAFLVPIDELRAQERVLDERAEGLDRRDVELRELERRLAGISEQHELHRQELLTERQQMETARETSFAEPDSDSNADVYPDDGCEDNARDDARSETYSRQAEPASYRGISPADLNEKKAPAISELRSEIASLFGLNARKDTTSATESAEEVETSAADLQAVGVSFSFDGSEELIADSAGTNDDDESAGSADDGSQSFMTNYMEQLLARSRKSAGGTLPAELQKKSTANSRDSSPAVKPRQPVKSFIDQYMAGGVSEAPAAVAMETDQSECAQSRFADETCPLPQRLDREKLRKNMDSFRSLSANSVERALAAAAVRRERHKIFGRGVLIVVLLLLNGLQLAAINVGIYEHTLVVWLTTAATILAGFELARKVRSLRSQFRGAITRRREGIAVKSALKIEAVSGAEIPVVAGAACDQSSHGHVMIASAESSNETPQNCIETSEAAEPSMREDAGGRDITKGESSHRPALSETSARPKSLRFEADSDPSFEL